LYLSMKVFSRPY